MAIIINIDVMLAKRKMSVMELILKIKKYLKFRRQIDV